MTSSRDLLRVSPVDLDLAGEPGGYRMSVSICVYYRESPCDQASHQVSCAVLCLVAHSCPTFCDPMDCSPSGSIDCSPPGSSVRGDSSGKNTRVECQALLQGNLPKPGIKPRSPALQVDSLSARPSSRGIFPNQGSNPGLLRYRQILYQLSHQVS